MYYTMYNQPKHSFNYKYTLFILSVELENNKFKISVKICSIV